MLERIISLFLKPSLLLITFLLTAVCNETKAQNVDVTVKTNLTVPKVKWWTDAKFGMFIHWGLYALPAGQWNDKTDYAEWLMQQEKIPRDTYAALAKKFNPKQFNAEDWVKLARAAGQKYIVITTKHHDGFAMFKTAASPFNIVDATPYKSDIIKALAEACRKFDMKLGFYYSQAQDWYHPGGAVSKDLEWDESHKGSMDTYFDKIVVPQVTELLENYGDVAILWWDTPKNISPAMAQKVTAILEKYPKTLTNNRLGGGAGGDWETPEQFIPATGFPGRNWEVCMTMNGHWGYNAYDERWKTTSELLHKLVDIVSKGGNFLLNVGPNQYGEIPKISQQILLEMGDWLATNSEAIYGASASPFNYLSWGRATRKGNIIYLHVFDWPKNGILNVPLTNRIKKAYLLADKNKPLKFASTKNDSQIILPTYGPDKNVSVIAIEIIGEPNVVTLPSIAKVVKASSTSLNAKNYFLNDGEPKTIWRAKAEDREAILELDLGSVKTIEALALVEPWYPWSNISQSFELQNFDGKTWKTVTKSTTEGTGFTLNFSPVNAQKFRLLLANKTEAPALAEWILYTSK